MIDEEFEASMFSASSIRFAMMAARFLSTESGTFAGGVVRLTSWRKAVLSSDMREGGMRKGMKLFNYCYWYYYKSKSLKDKNKWFDLIL